MDSMQNAASSGTGLYQNQGPFQNSTGGSVFFNQIPQQRVPVLLYQGAVTGGTWTKLLASRTPFLQVQDFWVCNRGGSNMDGYLALPGPLSTFSSTGGLSQEDVFQLFSDTQKLFRETGSYVAISPRQEVWFYCTQAANIRLSGLQVST